MQTERGFWECSGSVGVVRSSLNDGSAQGGPAALSSSCGVFEAVRQWRLRAAVFGEDKRSELRSAAPVEESFLDAHTCGAQGRVRTGEDAPRPEDRAGLPLQVHLKVLWAAQEAVEVARKGGERREVGHLDDRVRCWHEVLYVGRTQVDRDGAQHKRLVQLLRDVVDRRAVLDDKRERVLRHHAGLLRETDLRLAATLFLEALSDLLGGSPAAPRRVLQGVCLHALPVAVDGEVLSQLRNNAVAPVACKLAVGGNVHCSAARLLGRPVIRIVDNPRICNTVPADTPVEVVQGNVAAQRVADSQVEVVPPRLLVVAADVAVRVVLAQPLAATLDVLDVPPYENLAQRVARPVVDQDVLRQEPCRVHQHCVCLGHSILPRDQVAAHRALQRILRHPWDVRQPYCDARPVGFGFVARVARVFEARVLSVGQSFIFKSEKWTSVAKGQPVRELVKGTVVAPPPINGVEAGI
eukprot:Rhum_TRINITY_DN21389_c0_g1::Rhum_TRINITY_DN21389_c0_g1_i1::g.173932::m.173932